MPYIGRSGWNNLRSGSAIPDDEIFEAVDASYAMVVAQAAKEGPPAVAGQRRARARSRGLAATAAGKHACGQCANSRTWGR